MDDQLIERFLMSPAPLTLLVDNQSLDDADNGGIMTWLLDQLQKRRKKVAYTASQTRREVVYARLCLREAFQQLRPSSTKAASAAMYLPSARIMARSNGDVTSARTLARN